MARINIEDKLFKDNRFTDLCIALGSRRIAIGALVEAWILAQQNVKPSNPKGLVSEEQWEDQNIAPEIIKCKLAKKTGGFVEIVGGEENFAWLVQRQVAGASGGRKKAEVVPEPIKQQKAEPTATDRLADTSKRKQTEANGSLLSLSPSLSPSQDSFSNSDSDLNTKVPKPKKIKEPESPGAKEGRSRIKQEFINAYRLRYGIEPNVENAAFNSQAMTLQKKLGTDEACSVVRFYLTHNKSFYVENTHSFWVCVKDADTLRTQMLRGKAITKTMVRDFEKKVHSHELDEQIGNLWKDE